MRPAIRSTPLSSRLFTAGVVALLSLTRQATAQEMTVRSHDGRATLTLPPNAIPAGVTVTIANVVPETDPAVVNTSRYRIDPPTLRFVSPGTLVVKYESAGIPAGARDGSLRIVRLDSSGWTAMPQAPGTSHARIATATVDGGGVVAVRWYSGGAHCTGPEYHVLDFRLGVWDYRAAGYDPGRATIGADPSACALFEHYVDVTGGRAERFYLYDSAARAWAVTTIDPGGRSLSTTAIDPRGLAVVTGNDREVFSREPSGQVILTGEHTADGGRTWTPVYKAVYTPVAIR